jgi:hypothetical protein
MAFGTGAKKAAKVAQSDAQATTTQTTVSQSSDTPPLSSYFGILATIGAVGVGALMMAGGEGGGRKRQNSRSSDYGSKRAKFEYNFGM